MPLTKVCPQCIAAVNVRRLACECGHFFASKRRAPVVTMKSKRIAIGSKRKLESADETLLRQRKDSIRHAQARALESRVDTLRQLKCDRMRTATKRDLETQG